VELIDSHCHLTYDAFIADLDTVLERSRAAQVTRWVAIGTDIEHSQKAIDLAQQHEGLYATVGYHPHEAKAVDDPVIKTLASLAGNDQVVAIGETGLDFHYDFSPRADQERAFVQQLKLAVEVGLPVIIHTREAFQETLAVLEPFRPDLDRVVMHCFTGSEDEAQAALDCGYWISFSGVITFNNADEIRRAAKRVPLDRLMIETDSPYLSPAPMRKQKINEPALLIHTAHFLANLLEMPVEELAQTTIQNTQRFYGLGPE
jgi:TatD DNase family protein